MPNREEKRKEKLEKLDENKRLNKKVERRYKRYNRQKLKAQSKMLKGKPKKLERLEKRKGYNYDIGEYDPETKHWSSLSKHGDGEIAKGRRHPSIIKTKKAERLLGNKIIKRDGKMYSVPKKRTLKKALKGNKNG